VDLQCTQQYLAFFDFSYKFNTSVLCFQYRSFKKQEAFCIVQLLPNSFFSNDLCVVDYDARSILIQIKLYLGETSKQNPASGWGIGYYGHFTIIQVMNLKFLEQHLQHPQEKIKIKIKIKIETSETRNNWTNRLLHATVIKTTLMGCWQSK